MRGFASGSSCSGPWPTSRAPLEIYEAARRAHGDEPFAGRAVTLHALGRTEEAEAELARLEEHAKTRYVPPSLLGWANLVLGHEREGLEHMEEAVTARDGFIAWVPFFDGMEVWRNDPRILDVMRGLGFTG